MRKELIVQDNYTAANTTLNRVFVYFIIDENGGIMNVNARSSNAALEEEAIKATHKLPTLIPGQQKGKNVRVSYTFQITFDTK